MVCGAAMLPLPTPGDAAHDEKARSARRQAAGVCARGILLAPAAVGRAHALLEDHNLGRCGLNRIRFGDRPREARLHPLSDLERLERHGAAPLALLP